MSTRTRTGPYTFADFVELIPDDQKADLIEGAIYMASPESTDHNKLVSWLDRVIGNFVQERGLGETTVNKVAFRLTDRSAPEPDFAFVRAERAKDIRSGHVDGPPDLAIEIVSPDSVDRDYRAKRELYEAAGVPEYWIIDPDEKTVTFLARGDSGRFVETPPENFLFRSRVLPGFAIDVRWLWQRPLPSAMATVQRLLADA
jgi:Uma2 family endonuclease